MTLVMFPDGTTAQPDSPRVKAELKDRQDNENPN